MLYSLSGRRDSKFQTVFKWIPRDRFNSLSGIRVNSRPSFISLSGRRIKNILKKILTNEISYAILIPE